MASKRATVGSFLLRCQERSELTSKQERGTSHSGLNATVLLQSTLVRYISIETICNFNLKLLLWLYTKVQFHGNLLLSITNGCDKGKGSCFGKRGERWYHIVDNLQLIIVTRFTFHKCVVPFI